MISVVAILESRVFQFNRRIAFQMIDQSVHTPGIGMPVVIIVVAKDSGHYKLDLFDDVHIAGGGG